MRNPKTILIVDDEPNVRLVLQTALASAGYAVIEAEDGQAALERLRDTPCSLILLDLRMPKMDGMELLRRLRALGNAIPVVILTAHGSIPDAVEAMKLGAIDFLTKPITPDALRRVGRRSDRAPGRSGGPAAAGRRAGRSIEANRLRPRPRQARHESGPVQRGRAAASRDHRARSRLDRGPRASRPAARRSRRGRGGSFRILRDWFPSGS